MSSNSKNMITYTVEKPGILIVREHGNPVLIVDILDVEASKKEGYSGCYVCGAFVNFLGRGKDGNLYRFVDVNRREEYLVSVKEEDEEKAKELLKKSLEISKVEFEVFVKAFFEHVEKNGSLIVEPLDFDFNIGLYKVEENRLRNINGGEYVVVRRKTMKEHLAIEKMNKFLEKIGYKIIVYSDSPGNYAYIIIPTRIREEALVDLAVGLDEEPDTITRLAILNYRHEYNDNSPDHEVFRKLLTSMQETILKSLYGSLTSKEKEERTQTRVHVI